MHRLHLSWRVLGGFLAAGLLALALPLPGQNAPPAPTPAPAAGSALELLQQAMKELGERPDYDARLSVETNLPDGEEVKTLLGRGRIATGELGHFWVYFAGAGAKDLEVYVRGRARAARELEDGKWAAASGDRGPGLLPVFRFPTDLWLTIGSAIQSCDRGGTQWIGGHECTLLNVGLRAEAVQDLAAAWKGKFALDPESLLASAIVWIDAARGQLEAATLQVDASARATAGVNPDQVPRLYYFLRLEIPNRPREQPVAFPADVETLLK
ncbi:MAG: hypothetical protein HYZ53_17320 [Planctomycetes bacterium]|nr:hypothetical protein [Planctomycetota bacterium]